VEKCPHVCPCETVSEILGRHPTYETAHKRPNLIRTHKGMRAEAKKKQGKNF